MTDSIAVSGKRVDTVSVAADSDGDDNGGDTDLTDDADDTSDDQLSDDDIDDQEEKEDDSMPGFGVLIAMLAILVSLALASRYRATRG